MTPAERFKIIRNHLSLNQEEMAQIFQFKWHKIKDIEIGKQKVSVELAEMIENKFSISGWWLLTGRGNMFIDDNKFSNINVNNSKNVAVNNGNGTITINANDYVDSNEIRELLEILKDVPKSWVKNIIERLKKSLNTIDDLY